MLYINSRIQIPLSDFELTFARSSGPGGQNVNKVNSKAVLRWKPLECGALPLDVRARFAERFGGRLTAAGELVVTSDRYRDQPRNREDCFEKIIELVRLVAEPPIPRRKTKPTRGSKVRRAKGKQLRGDTKKLRGRVRGE